MTGIGVTGLVLLYFGARLPSVALYRFADRETPMTLSIKVRPANLAAIFMIIASGSAWATTGTVNVLYAGSLVNLMERSAGPAFEQNSSDRFQGYAGGSNKVANEIKGRLRRGDVFVSANPKIDDQLMGEANGDWVRWYIAFAESPLVIGYNPSSRFVNDLKNKPWYEVLAEPGLKLGRTDPKLDPKGALTIELLKRAEAFYSKPSLSQQIIGDPDNPAQVLPEETLVGRLQSGQLDVGFFYSTETSDAKIPAINLPDEIVPKARYTVTILRDAPNPGGAEWFVRFLLGSQGRDLLKQHGLELLKPNLKGDASAVPAAVKSLVDSAQ
jgi:molybdate/tungstate transport system substrate-binding protein